MTRSWRVYYSYRFDHCVDNDNQFDLADHADYMLILLIMPTVFSCLSAVSNFTDFQAGLEQSAGYYSSGIWVLGAPPPPPPAAEPAAKVAAAGWF